MIDEKLEQCFDYCKRGENVNGVDAPTAKIELTAAKERGFVTIRDQAGIEVFAADAYGQLEMEYRRFSGTT